MKLKEFLEKNFKDPKKFLKSTFIAFLLGILLILMGDLAGGLFVKQDKNKSTNASLQQEQEIQVSSNAEESFGSKDYEEKLKKEVANTLMQIKGVGKVSVMIYFEGSSESIPALNTTDNNKKTEESDKEGGQRTITESGKNSTVVTVDSEGKKQALILKEIRPSIGGVIIVAEGAENSAIKEEVTNAVKILLNLPQNKVIVSPMKKS